MAENTIIKYPDDIASQVRNKTFSIRECLAPVIPDEGDSPMLLHAPYSRFVCTAIDSQNGKRVFATANIPTDDCPDIFERTKIAIKDIVEFERQKTIAAPSSESGGSGIAFTQILRCGTSEVKGKTPAAVLLEDASKKTALAGQSKWLRDAVAKDPAGRFAKDNLAQADAIDAAIALLDAGKLTSSGGNTEGTGLSQNGGIIKIYDAAMKPLMSRKREDGKVFVYGINISCHVGDNYPFVVTITNFYAPVAKKPNGQLNVFAKDMDKSTLLKVEMKLTEAEWAYDVNQMQTALRIFERKYGEAMYKRAEQARFDNMQRAKPNSMVR